MTRHWCDLTPEEKGKFIEPLAKKGKSSGQISKELHPSFGTIPRSSIVSLCSKLKIPLLGRGRHKRNRQGPTLASAGLLKTPELPSVPVQTAYPDEPSDDSSFGPVTLDQLRDNQCKWPLWPDGESPAGGAFCGRKITRGSYCCEHAKRAYVDPDETSANVSNSKGEADGT